MRNLFLLGMCAFALASAAEAPYAGKWKLNPAKSDFGSVTVTYEQMPNGEMKCTSDGQSFTFKTDGKDVMTPWGVTQAWKTIDAKTWQVVEKTNGKETSSSTMSISPDGKELTVTAKRMKADGGTSNDTMTFQRVSGGPGLAGKWKAKNMTSSSPESMTLTPKGTDGVTLLLGNEGSTCDAKFDGKDYPATGAMWPAGWTCMISKHGTHGLNLTWRKDGKDMYKTTLTASADGKTLTESGSAVGTNEKYSMVYDKQ